MTETVGPQNPTPTSKLGRAGNRLTRVFQLHYHGTYLDKETAGSVSLANGRGCARLAHAWGGQFGSWALGVRSGLDPGSGQGAVSVSGLLSARLWVCASRASLKDGVPCWCEVTLGGPRPWGSALLVVAFFVPGECKTFYE